jgi:beta-glucosidase
MAQELTFPDGFEWSTATAAHQIEGANVNNDWWRFEHQVGSVCAESSGDACDSWNRWSDDVAVLAALGIPGYRFSLEWSRIEPAPGEWSNAALDHYLRCAEALLVAGIAPTITLNHFSIPAWIADLGGWTAPDAADRFGEFAARAANRLREVAHRFCTLNEPNSMTAVGYLMGCFPPGAVNDHAGYDAANAGLVRAHRAGVDAVRAEASRVPVGICLALKDYQAGPGGEAAVARSRAGEDLYLDATTGDDFVGVQNYTRMVMGPDGWIGPQAGAPVVEMMGYEYWPQALASVVRRAWERTGGLPIVVTENGIATADDAQRIRFLHEALVGLHGCIADGIDVRGYTCWSLLDNFEWLMGYKPRFGIVDVNRTTFERTPKPSAHWYSDVIRRNAISAELA